MRSKINNKRGFTLIEIVIVLAIAAALILLVFMAVSGAQRAKRDEINRTAAGRVVAAIEQYDDNGASLCGCGYLLAGQSLPSTYLNGITDSQGNTPVGVDDYGAGSPIEPSYVIYSGQATCIPNGRGYIQAGRGTQFAVSYYLESGNVAVCIDNT